MTIHPTFLAGNAVDVRARRRPAATGTAALGAAPVQAIDHSIHH